MPIPSRQIKATLLTAEIGSVILLIVMWEISGRIIDCSSLEQRINVEIASKSAAYIILLVGFIPRICRHLLWVYPNQSIRDGLRSYFQKMFLVEAICIGSVAIGIATNPWLLAFSFVCIPFIIPLHAFRGMGKVPRSLKGRFGVSIYFNLSLSLAAILFVNSVCGK